MDKRIFAMAMEEFIQKKKLENKKEATLAKYQNRLKQVASKLPDSTIDEKALYPFLLEYQQSRSPWTTMGMVIVLNDFLKFCKQKDT